MRVNEVLSRINDSTPIMLIIGDFILHTGTKRTIYSNIIYQRNRQKYGGALVTEILLDDKRRISMRLDQFLKCIDSSTQVKINLITAEPDKEIITVIGTKKEVIPTLISKDISDFDVFDIYEVSIRNVTYGSKGEYKYQVIYLLAKENF